MSNQINRIVSDSDRAAMELYWSLTPENRQKATAYLAALAASQCTPVPFPDSQR